MKDYNFMISEDRLHKTRFCKKKEGYPKLSPLRGGDGGLEQKGGLERFRILRGVWPKRGGWLF